MYCLKKQTVQWVIRTTGVRVHVPCTGTVRPGKISSRKTRHITEAKQYKRSGARYRDVAIQTLPSKICNLEARCHRVAVTRK